MANDPATTFRDLFDNMPDLHNGIYQPFLAEYAPNNQVNSEELLRQTLIRLPTDQVPSVFIYQDEQTLLRTVHHLHQVETPFGQEPTPLSNMYLAFSGEIYNGNAQVVRLRPADFFMPTGNIAVLTIPALTAQVAAAPNGMVGPLLEGDPDTEMINTRKAVPVPHEYVRLVAFRTLHPQEAWQQVAGQVAEDGREEDCRVFLNFLRAATVVTRGPGRNAPNGPPATNQLIAFSPPVDGPVLEHVHRKLRLILPAAFQQQLPGEGPRVAAMVNRTVAEGFEALRADRAEDRAAAAVPKPFSEVFPATAAGIRRLCLAGDNDELLPRFWRFFATIKGKKGAGLSAFSNFLVERAKEPDSARVRPVVSTTLYSNVSAFEVGAADLEVITQGISPFLMCPNGYMKANTTTLLTQKYMMLQGDNSLPLLTDIQQLIPTNDYNIPDDLYTLADFIGAYSVVWDILVGENHPLALAIRAHFFFWSEYTRTVKKAISEAYLLNVVIVGTLRYIQLNVLRYVNEVMYVDHHVPVPSFRHIEDAVHNRIFQTFPTLPAQYQAPTVSHKNLPPFPPANIQPPTTPNPNAPKGKQMVAPGPERNQGLLDSFSQSGKMVQQLKDLPNQPKAKGTTGNLCLSYHLRGLCYDNCRRSNTHRKLEAGEVGNMQTFLRNNI